MAKHNCKPWAVSFSLVLTVLLLSSSNGFQISNEARFKKYVVSSSTSLPVTKQNSKDDNILSVEQEVLDASKAKLDVKRVTRFLEDNDDGNSNMIEKNSYQPQSPWGIALASGALCSTAAFFAFQNLILSGILFATVVWVAMGDPIEEGNEAGAVARILGRATIQSYKASAPKVKAVARAAVRGEDEVALMKTRIKELEVENEDLKLWRDRRLAVDEALPDYGLDDLKDQARKNGLKIGGTKAQLMMRLVEAGILKL